MSTVSLQAVVVIQPDLVVAPLGHEEVVVLHVESGRYYSLQAVGTDVWELIQQPRRVSDIVEHIASAYDVDAARCEADVLGLLARLAENQLISVQADVAR